MVQMDFLVKAWLETKENEDPQDCLDCKAEMENQEWKVCLP